MQRLMKNMEGIIIPIIQRGGSIYINLKKEILKKYDLHAGDYLSVSLDDDGFTCRKIKEIIT